MQVKHNGKRYHGGKSEVIRKKRVGPRPGRYHPPQLVVEAVNFQGSGCHGDYYWQLQDAQQKDPKYGRSLHIYNENMSQQNDKTSNTPGGGNACARPFRQCGRSIGIPTGHYGGFSGLDEHCHGNGYDCTAKEGIDLAIEEIISHVLNNPGRFERIYYCSEGKNNPLIGTGIFNVEANTLNYITDKILSLPRAIYYRSVVNRRMMFDS